MNFSKEYWDKNYSHPDTMDGIGNARKHAKYLSSLFSLQEIDVNSIVDLGFGYGKLLTEFSKVFKPALISGIEPSEHAFNKFTKTANTNFQLENITIEQWLKGNKKVYDLGICNSVFQYIETDEVVDILKKISKRVKYLYFSVPTDKELEIQYKEFNFKDEYAIRRNKDFYQKAIGAGFHVVSSRLLESKFFFKENNTMFTDLFYRT